MMAFDLSSSRTLPPGLIVNADDLAIHPDISAGIVSAYRHGIVTSGSLLMTTPYLEQTIRDFVGPAEMPIGVHLSLTHGHAIAPASQVPDLVDAAGKFKLSAFRLLLSSPAHDNGRRLFEQIRRELAAQLALARDHGLAPTHVDSHQHVHMNPALFDLVQGLAPHFGVESIRFAREPASFPTAGELLPAIRRKNQLKWAMIRWLARGIVPRLRTTDTFFGLLQSGIMSKSVLLPLLRKLRLDGSYEICIHPGFRPVKVAGAAGTVDGVDSFTTSPFRRREHDALIDADVIDQVRRSGLRLSTFAGEAKDLAAAADP